MVSFRTISAWIESEGRELKTYKWTESWPQRQDGHDYPTISCWIASELGQNFEICFTDYDLRDSICGYIEIDGTRCGSKFLRAPMDNGKVMRKDGARTSETELSWFQFADVATTDDDDYQGHSIEGMGEIKVMVKAVDIGRGYDSGSRRGRGRSYQSFERKIFHEKDKKGLMHTVRFAPRNAADGGGIGPHRSRPPLRVTPRTPLVEFVFRYAPLDKLRADGIAPYPEPPPVKAEVKTKIEEEMESKAFVDLTGENDDQDGTPPARRPREKIFIDLTLDGDVDFKWPKEEEEEIIVIDDDDDDFEHGEKYYNEIVY